MNRSIWQNISWKEKYRINEISDHPVSCPLFPYSNVLSLLHSSSPSAVSSNGHVQFQNLGVRGCSSQKELSVWKKQLPQGLIQGPVLGISKMVPIVFECLVVLVESLPPPVSSGQLRKLLLSFMLFLISYHHTILFCLLPSCSPCVGCELWV